MQTIDINLIPNGIPEKVYVNQYDIDRTFELVLYDGNSLYTFPSNPYSITINGRKEDDHCFQYNETYEGATVIEKDAAHHKLIIHTTEQMTAAPGDCLCQVCFIKGSMEIGTLNFVLDVQEMPFANGDPSGSELPAVISRATAEMNRAIQEATNAANSATAAANSATAANTAKNDAVTAKNAAVSAKDDAVTAKNAAISAKNDAQAAASTASAAALHPPYIGANGNWYVWNTTSSAYVDSHVDASITVQIADITMLEPSATPTVTNTGTDTDPVFHLGIPRGKGISSISKTGTSGLVDTYTITYSDGYTSTFTVTNGNGITNITKTNTSGLVDTYTITFDNGTTKTFTVTNGKTAYQSAVDGGYIGTEQQFEADLAEFKTLAESAEDSAELSESWAVGGTNSRTGENTNNSKYWSIQARVQAVEAEHQADIATAYASFVTPHYLIQNNRLYVKDDAAPQWTMANNRLYVKVVS